MKTKAIFFGTALVLLAFSSCQKIQDSLVVKVPMEFSNDLNVTAGELELKSGGFKYYASKTFNPKTDPTYLKYQDKIKRVTAKGFSYTPTHDCPLKID